MASILLSNFGSAVAQSPAAPPPPPTPETPSGTPPLGYHGRPTNAERAAAAQRAAAARAASPSAQAYPPGLVGAYTSTIDYFGTIPNYANSPQALVDVQTTVTDLAGTGSGANIDAIVGGVVSLTGGTAGACTVAPKAVFTGGGGYGATADVRLNGAGGVVVTLNSSGSLYTSNPVISFVGGTCATAPTPPTATAAPWTVTGLAIWSGGSGYISPTISFSSTQTAHAQATAILTATDGIISDYLVTSPGATYAMVTDANGVHGLRKFVDTLPTLFSQNDLGQYLPIAVADQTTYPGTDYYEIGLVQYMVKMHADLPPTLLRGYVQLQTSVVTATNPITLTNVLSTGVVNVTYPNGPNKDQQVYALTTPQYLGPIISATSNRPTRIKFYNFLPTGSGGDLFIPTDTTYMGAGMGPVGTVNAISITNPGSGYTLPPTVTISNPPTCPTPPFASAAECRATAQAYILNGSVSQIRLINPGANYTGTITVTIGAPTTGTNRATAIAIASPTGGVYTENRATLHLHGGNTPWISDGTPDQWTTPANETTPYPKGVSVYNVPDMPDPGDGSLTFYYTNQQSARLMFYHDHAYGLTRLNVYGGEAAGYRVSDPVEATLMNGGVITPANGAGAAVTVAAGTLPSIATQHEIPLVIQDRTFVDATRIYYQDPTWRWGLTPTVARTGDLWFPHVYMPNQNPYTLDGTNPMGRWDYGPWFWPPQNTFLAQGPITNTLFGADPNEAPVMPGTPNPSGTPEGFMDTPVVNGTVYPVLKVDPTAYRFRILNAANDRTLHLSLFKAASNNPMWTGVGSTVLNDAGAGEVPMVTAAQSPGGPAFPASWQTQDVLDNRAGGIPDPAAIGPDWLQIGSEGGFLPGLATLHPQPVGFEYFRRSITVLNISSHGLLMGPAERADVVVDFSQYAGQTLILYNDAPAPVPAFDTRVDYFTGDGNQTNTGGAPNTLPGYGPNTRTVMQIQVAAAVGTNQPAPAAVWPGKAALAAAMPAAFNAAQPTIIVPQAPYNAAYGATNFPADTSAYVRIADTQLTFTPTLQTTPITMELESKAIQELFTTDYGRMNATMGVEIPKTNNQVQTTIPYGYAEVPTELLRTGDGVAPIGSLLDGTQIWKVTHNGVDTHFIHFHMFNVEVLNRVGWDGTVKPPDANELGWKDTVRMNPLEDAIIATRPIIPSLPFQIGDSIRLLDVTQAPGTVFNANAQLNINPFNAAPNPADNVNHLVNFGWEYVWHCHILGHEENDMMRAMIIGVPPFVPQNFTVSLLGTTATLAWTDTSVNATGYVVERSTNGTTWITTTLPSTARSTSFTGLTPGTTYQFRVSGTNFVGDTGTLAGSAVAQYGRVSTWSSQANALAMSVLNVTSAPSPIRTVFVARPTPTTPALRVTGSTATSISLAWTSGGTGATYTLQRSVGAPGNWQPVPGYGGSNLFYTNTGLTTGTTYYYRVRATIAGVNSNWSNTVSRTAQ